MKRSYSLLIIFLSAFCSCLTAGELTTRGAYGGVKALWQAGCTLDGLGINAVFTGGEYLDSAQVARIRAEGARIYAEFPALNGNGYVEKHPEAWPIDRYGQRSPQADWFMGVCPTEPGFRASRMKALRDLLRRHRLDGVWMDYVHWHAQFESPAPILPETCFCDHCLTAFQASTGVAVPAGSTPERADWILSNTEREWRDWRCDVVTGWARDMKEIIRRESPGALLGLFHAPWNDTDHDGARRRILGLDFQQLARVVDVFSPMVYHGRMGRSPEWVGEYVAWFCGALGLDGEHGPRVWPIVQASDEPVAVSPEEFRRVMELGLSGCADGVMMFTVHAIARDPAKLEVLRGIYNRGH